MFLVWTPSNNVILNWKVCVTMEVTWKNSSLKRLNRREIEVGNWWKYCCSVRYFHNGTWQFDIGLDILDFVLVKWNSWTWVSTPTLSLWRSVFNSYEECMKLSHRNNFLKDLMPITFSPPSAQPEVVHFLISNESPYFSSCKPKISTSNSLQFWRYDKKCEVNWYTRK